LYKTKKVASQAMRMVTWRETELTDDAMLPV